MKEQLNNCKKKDEDNEKIENSLVVKRRVLSYILKIIYLKPAE